MSKLRKLFHDVLSNQLVTGSIPRENRHVYFHGPATTYSHPWSHVNLTSNDQGAPVIMSLNVDFIVRRKGSEATYEIRQFELKYYGEDAKFLRRERLEMLMTTRVVILKPDAAGNYRLQGRHTEELFHNALYLITDSDIEVNRPSVLRTGKTTEYDDVQTIVDTIENFREIDNLNMEGWPLSQRFHVSPSGPPAVYPRTPDAVESDD